MVYLFGELLLLYNSSKEVHVACPVGLDAVDSFRNSLQGVVHASRHAIEGLKCCMGLSQKKSDACMVSMQSFIAAALQIVRVRQYRNARCKCIVR